MIEIQQPTAEEGNITIFLQTDTGYFRLIERVKGDSKPPLDPEDISGFVENYNLIHQAVFCMCYPDIPAHRLTEALCSLQFRNGGSNVSEDTELYSSLWFSY